MHDEVKLSPQLVQVECDPLPVEVVHPAVADAQVGVVLNVRVDQRGSPEMKREKKLPQLGTRDILNVN